MNINDRVQIISGILRGKEGIVKGFSDLSTDGTYVVNATILLDNGDIVSLNVITLKKIEE